MLQNCHEDPTQSAPVPDCAGHAHTRDCTPPPQVALHVPKSHHPPSVPQLCVLHVCVASPTHVAPFPWGAGQAHALVCVPPPVKRIDILLLSHFGQREREKERERTDDDSPHDAEQSP